MNRRALALLLPVALLCAGTFAHASQRTTPPGAMSKLLYRVYGSIEVPPEWAGIWTVTDSVYDCNRVFQSFTTEDDTLCSGMIVYDTPPEGEFQIDCTGTSDGDEIHAICTGSSPIDSCTMDYYFKTDGVRTSDSYSIETRFELTVTGPSNPCDFFPDQCNISRSHGTRIQPEPVAYCATPAEMSTWGKVKSRYR